MARLSANIAAFLILLLAFLLLIGMQLLLVSALQTRMAEVNTSYRFWSRGVQLDLLGKLTPSARSAVMETIQRELTRTPRGCCGPGGAAFQRAARHCARQHSRCAELETLMWQASDESSSRFKMLSTGGTLVLLALALAFLGLGASLIWVARHSLRLLAVLGVLCWGASLGLQIYLFASGTQQTISSATVNRLVTRARLIIALEPQVMKLELDRLLVNLRQTSVVPPRQRGTLELALLACRHAAHRESRWKARCRRRPGSCRPRPSFVAVSCPRVMIPLARAHAASIAAPHNTRTLSWLVYWLQVSAVLLLLLLLVLGGLDRRRKRG